MGEHKYRHGHSILHGMKPFRELWPLSKPAKYILISLGLGVLLGLLWLMTVRVILAKDEHTHYHANFAVYVDGERLQFVGPTFFEEVAACSMAGSDDPKTRVHMHDNVQDVVHVHDEAVTWGAFFANLRYGLSDKALTLDNSVLVDNQDGKNLVFILNGEPTTTIANRVIRSEDVLLINYGSEDSATIQQRYDSIKHTARHYNETADPSACSGSPPFTFKERLRRALSVNGGH